ncbi:aromatic ring-opening dioxygenase LigB subunit [Neurospora crassa OR74A]|uniref:Aromatic ring-opening dioxygenase LigB subunit n=2 Tax=Neurospora crassa TaxID=5141 RepID=Q1K921_NEUCR|nr:aromatic ring-opening dioxygenase LigB subunit [Neurospora crassa OR74A]EAA35414.2 aromatic ring-opening dioxygenase LigB subunit [Neurospora crassa OR74A]|eukprot:XP_964650.2 aromatic ring-opening dioxygenase LigB subunit [Neurospora crassa OR74A]
MPNPRPRSRPLMIVPVLVAALAILLASSSTARGLFSRVRSETFNKFTTALNNAPITTTTSTSTSPLQAAATANLTSSKMGRPPVYFFSHGGPDVQYNTKHPVYPVLQAIGKEIIQKVKPKAVVVFSAHWQATPSEIHLNNGDGPTDLIYDFYGFPDHFYKATFPATGSPQLAAKIQQLLTKADIQSKGLKRGLDHGVFSGFNVAFPPNTDQAITVPLVQVSLFKSEDPDAHYRLGQAVEELRDEGVVIICTGMTVHNLRDMQFTWGDPRPLPYAVSFDDALKEAVEGDAEGRLDRMREVVKRGDARQAHPWMDHLMPIYVAAGAAGKDKGVQTWTLHEGSFAWAQYRFGDVPEE